MPFDPPMPRSFSTSSIRSNAPSASGVYGITSAREWIYIGETDNIQAALLSHLRASDTSIMERQPTGFVFEVCDSGRRPGRLDRLVLEFEPSCNRQSSRYQ